MTILVVSETDLQSGQGHKKRILSVIDQLIQTYGRDHVHWINTVPTRGNVWKAGRRRAAIRKQYGDRASEVNVFIRIVPPFLAALFSRMFRCRLSQWLKRRYGLERPPLLWSEMTHSAVPYLPYRDQSQAPLIVDVHGTADELLMTQPAGALRDRRYAELVEAEKTVLSKAQGMVAVSSAMASVFETKFGKLPAVKQVVPMLAETEHFTWSMDAYERKRKQAGLESNFVFVYSGGTQAWQGIDAMLSFFSGLEKRPEVAPLKPYLLFLTWDRAFRWDVHRFPNARVAYASESEVPDYLAMADAGLLFRRDTLVNRIACPTKTAEYLLSGIPILATPYVGDVSAMLQETGTGFAIEPDGPYDFGAVKAWCEQVRRERAAIAARCVDVGTTYFGPQLAARFTETVEAVKRLMGGR